MPTDWEQLAAWYDRQQGDDGDLRHRTFRRWLTDDRSPYSTRRIASITSSLPGSAARSRTWA